MGGVPERWVEGRDKFEKTTKNDGQTEMMVERLETVVVFKNKPTA